MLKKIRVTLSIQNANKVAGGLVLPDLCQTGTKVHPLS